MAATPLARFLTCPDCSEFGTLTESGHEVACSKCGARFDCSDGIVDLVRGSFATALEADSYDDFYSEADAGRFEHLQQIIELAPELTARRWGAALEVGAGTGQFTSAFFKSVEVVDAVITDVSRAMLAVCRDRLESIGLECPTVLYATNSGEDLFARPGAFDLVIGNSVVHHVPYYPRLLASAARALSSGGIAVFVEPSLLFHRAVVSSLTPVMDRLLAMPDAWAGETDAAQVADFLMYLRFRDRYREDLGVLANLEDKHLLDRAEFSQLALDVGFSSVEVLPYGFDPDPRSVISGYLGQVAVHPATLERLSTELSRDLPGPFAALDPLDNAPSYVVIARRGDDPEPPAPSAGPTLVEGPEADDAAGLKYYISMSEEDSGPAAEGFIVASEPIRYLLIERDGIQYRFPVGASRIDVHAQFRELGYRADNLLFSGVLSAYPAQSTCPTGAGSGATVSIQFDDGGILQIASDLAPGHSTLSFFG